MAQKYCQEKIKTKSMTKEEAANNKLLTSRHVSKKISDVRSAYKKKHPEDIIDLSGNTKSNENSNKHDRTKKMRNNFSHRKLNNNNY